MKKLTFKININAAKQKVWNTMLQPDSYREWVNAAWPGSFYQGSWRQGEQIRFISDDGSGTLAKITALNPCVKIEAEHIAILLPGGVEDYTSDLAKNWIGITEQYNFEAKANETMITVDISTRPEWEKMFSDGWPAALNKLKQLCEN